MINVSVEFTDKGKFEKLIRYIEDNSIYFEAQAAMLDLANNTVEHMRTNINEDRKNPDRGTHKLENAIDTKIINDVGGIEIGIGEIAKLQSEAPYFEMINDGFTYTTRQTHIVPTTYFADKGSGFVTFKAGSKHTIQGIDYVGKALRTLETELADTITKLGGKLFGGMEKAI